MGAFNGWLVTRVNLPPFIVTLATLSIFFSLTAVVSRSETIRGSDMPAIMTATGNNAFRLAGFSLTWGTIIMLVLFAFFWYALGSTAWGKHVYATGDDVEAARLAGINTHRVLLSVYLVAGLIYAIGAWILMGRLASASPNVGTEYNLELHHRRRAGRHEPVRWPRAGARLPGRRVDRRRVPERAAARGRRRRLAGHRDRPARARRRGARPVDPEGEGMSSAALEKDPQPAAVREPVLQAKGLVKRYGKVTAIANSDLELYPGEILAVIGDNGAGKTSLIKALCGALIPDEGEILLDGQVVHFRSPMDARRAGIETVYQTLAVAPGLDIADNLFLGREERKPGVLGTVFRTLDKKHMRAEAARHMSELGVATLQNIGQAVESLSGGQRQAVAVARSAAFGSKVVILDEPTAALGVKEGNRVLQLIRDVRDRGLPVILISHNMPHVFEVADRIHIQRLGRRATVITPQSPHDVRGGGHHDRCCRTAAAGGLRPLQERPGASGTEAPGRSLLSLAPSTPTKPLPPLSNGRRPERPPQS